MAVTSLAALRDGSEVEVRPLDAADRERLFRLFYRLSPESVYHRFLSPLHHPHAAGLDRLIDLDHYQREAIAALSGDEIVGVARYYKDGVTATADMAVLVEDDWQRKGLSLILIERLRELARLRGIEAFTATILSENRPAISLVRRVFPRATLTIDGTETTAEMPFEAQLG